MLTQSTMIQNLKVRLHSDHSAKQEAVIQITHRKESLGKLKELL